MIGSHSKKFIFFHLYKVAGTSIRNVINKYSQFSTNAPHISPSKFFELEFNGFSGKYLFNEYISFAFVRNPWDW